jgi:hypothetical protein
MRAVALPPVLLWRNVSSRDTMACATCCGVWVRWLLGRVNRSWVQAGFCAS